SPPSEWRCQVLWAFGFAGLAFVCLGPTSSLGLRRPGPDGLCASSVGVKEASILAFRRRGSVRPRAGLPGRRGKTRICEMSSSFLLSSDSSRLRRCLSPAATASSAARPSPKRFATGEPRERGEARRGGGRARLPRVAGVVDELTLDVAPVLLGSGGRIFDGVESFGLEPVEVLHSPLATHIRYRRARGAD